MQGEIEAINYKGHEHVFALSEELKRVGFGMAGPLEQRRKVERIISKISEREGVGWSEARTMLHKYVCEGECSWYKTKSKKAGFDRPDLTEKQKRLIKEAIGENVKDLKMKEAKVRIHEVLCPGHPRTPKRSSK